MVKGSEVCELLGLFYDLGEAIQSGFLLKIQNLDRYKTAYTNKVKREMLLQDKKDKSEELAAAYDELQTLNINLQA